MKKSLLLLILFFGISSSSLAQQKLYLPDGSFKFKLAKFKMPLFQKEEIAGMYKDFFLIRTRIENTFTLLLVDKEGKILENFGRNWLLPQNWQAENSFWLYEPGLSPSGPSIVNILKYDFIRKKSEVKTIEVPSYYQYSEFKPTVNGDYFLCLNSRKDIFLFEFTSEKLTQIDTDNHEIISVNFDNKTNKINIFEMVYGSPGFNIKFYQTPIDEALDFKKHLKWTKDNHALKITNFYDTSNPNISFTSSTEFIVKYTKFEDTLCIAAKYDLDGQTIATFKLSSPQYLKFITFNKLWSDNYQITYIENTWFLTNSGVASIIYQKNESEKLLNLKNQYLLQSPDNLQSTSNKYFIFSDSTHNVLRTVNSKDLAIIEHSYKIPETEKSYDVFKVHTLADNTYWLFYNSPWGTYIKYNSNDEEIYRTPDSLYTAPDLNSFYQLNDTDVLIASYRHCNNCYRTLDKYLSVNNKNEASFLEPKNFLEGKPIFYYDLIHKHFYTNKDSLVRYTFDAQIDPSFHIETNIKVGSMLVSKQGNIYIGQTPFNYNIDSLYRLDSKGKVTWRKKYIFGEYNAYSQESAAGFYGGMYPLFNKDSIIIWGNLLCGEGCYTSNNVALDEHDKLVKLPYLEIRENNGPGYSFMDKYGVFIKNAQTFMTYNPAKNAIEKDMDTSIKFATNYYEINELDVLPNQDLLIVERNLLRKYSFRKTIWATITNLEKEKENNSYSFWGLAVKDAINRQIKLDVFTSDSSQAILKVIPENSDVAYIKDQTLFFTGKEGKVVVYAQSIKGGEPYISPEFTVKKGTPFYEIFPDSRELYPNTSIGIKFESVDGISFKIDSVQGSCKLQGDKIVSAPPSQPDCMVFFSWTGSDIYASGNSVIFFIVFDELRLSNDEISIFPNPLIQNILTIKSAEPITMTNIINMQGQKMQAVLFQNYSKEGHFLSEFQINSKFNPGIYIIEILNDRGVVIKREKLIIAR